MPNRIDAFIWMYLIVSPMAYFLFGSKSDNLFHLIGFSTTLIIVCLSLIYDQIRKIKEMVFLIEAKQNRKF